jgi:ABC-type phosphate transport system auxiliary subunit
MKKVVRTVWIGALSGLAFLAACCTQNGLTRKERKQLVKERDSIQEILTRREVAAVYGSPEIIANYKLENLRMQSRLDTINAQLGEEVDLEKSAQRVALQERIANLQAALQRREGACVYGSPEVLEEYGKETRRMRDELEAVRKELRELEKSEGSKINDGKVEALYGVPVP